MTKGILYSIVAALALQPAIAGAAPPEPVAAAPLALPYQSAGLPTAAQVSVFYAGWHYAPIWFSGNSVKPAANDLIALLQRAPLDGIAAGPNYATQLQAAVQQAATGSPQAIAYAEHSLSEALVLYAQMMKRPVAGMLYGYDYMKPKAPGADEVLRIASAAPSLQMYLQQVANPNTVYTSIRDAAWTQMQSTGSLVADPRVVANLDRARGMPAAGRFVMVNPATQMLYMYDNGAPVGSMKVVVGDTGAHLHRDGTRTPPMTSMLFYVIHNPYWNSPDNLTRENIAPRYAAEGDKYMKMRGFNVMSDWTKSASIIPASDVDWKGVRSGKVHIRVRQDPGPQNFMGQLKFPFANPEGIYLHDTDPGDRDLFSLAERTRSNGCIRLEDAPRLATWLLGHQPAAFDGQAEYPEQLTRGVPVYVVYLTAQPKDGQLTFVKDVYGWDPAGTAQIADGK